MHRHTKFTCFPINIIIKRMNREIERERERDRGKKAEDGV